MSLTDEIARARQHNQHYLEKSLELQRPEFTPQDRLVVENFRVFCRAKGVDAALQPVTVAAYLAAQSERDIEPAMAAIQAWAHYYFQSDPCSSVPVRTVLERPLRIGFPRSWNKDERPLFAALPPEVRSVIYNREQQRDAALRRSQNEMAGNAKKIGVAAELRNYIQNKRKNYKHETR
jgi:hypothetical protein